MELGFAHYHIEFVTYFGLNPTFLIFGATYVAAVFNTTDTLSLGKNIYTNECAQAW